MAIKNNETYPGRADNPSTDYPQGKARNRSAPDAHDGMYLDEKWFNDNLGFLGALLRAANIVPNGEVDTALNSQYFDALKTVIKNETTGKVINNTSVNMVQTDGLYAIGTNVTDLPFTDCKSLIVAGKVGQIAISGTKMSYRVIGGQWQSAGGETTPSPWFNLGALNNGLVFKSEFDVALDVATGLYFRHVGNYPFTYSGVRDELQIVFLENYKAEFEDSYYNTPIPISKVSVLESEMVITVQNTSSFKIGKYAGIESTATDSLQYAGLFKVREVNTSANTVTVNATVNSLMQYNENAVGLRAVPMNNVVESKLGAICFNSIDSIKGLVIDCLSSSKYGLRLGGTHSSGFYRPVGHISALTSFAVINGSKDGTSADDGVAILAGNGSTLGVNNVFVDSFKIGVEAFRNSSIIGSKVFVRNTSNDAFKCEHTSNMYLLYSNAIDCRGGYASRYTSALELSNTLALNCTDYGCISQYSSYASIRLSVIDTTNRGLYSSIESTLFIGGNISISNSSVGLESNLGTIANNTGTVTIGNTNALTFINTSGSIRITSLVGDVGKNSVSGKVAVTINGDDLTAQKVVIDATIEPYKRAGVEYIKKLKHVEPVVYTAACKNKDDVYGHYPQVLNISEDRARLLIYNIRDTNITLSGVEFTIME